MFITPAINLLIDWVKWRREIRNTSTNDLRAATTEFLDTLQYFSTRTTQGEYEHILGPEISKMRRAYFEWELVISASTKPEDKVFLDDVANKVLGSPHSLQDYHPDLSNAILDFSKEINNRS